jgi:hypothetical protein
MQLEQPNAKDLIRSAAQRNDGWKLSSELQVKAAVKADGPVMS